MGSFDAVYSRPRIQVSSGDSRLRKFRSRVSVDSASDNPNTLALFENVTGTSEADWIKGNAAANLICGLGGDDTIHGGDPQRRLRPGQRLLSWRQGLRDRTG